MLPERGADSNASNFRGVSPLMRAVEKDASDIVRMLLRCSNINIIISHVCVEHKHVDLVRELLLKHKVNVQAVDRQHKTALDLENWLRYNEIAVLLLNAINTPELQSPISERDKPKFWNGVETGSLGAVAKVLSTHPNAISLVDDSGNTPLHLAVRRA